MGIALALTSAGLFALQSIFIRIGQRVRRNDDGLFMSVSMNILVALVVLPFSSGAPWNWTAFLAFALAGIATTWLGRGTALRAIRLIGPARQSAFLISAPIFTGIAGWVILDESPTTLQMAGGMLVLGGLGVLVRSKVTAEPVIAREGAAAFEGGFQSQGGSIAIPTAASRRTKGYVIAILSAVSFGLGFVARAWGLDHYPNAVFGALVGALISMALIIGRESLNGRLGALLHDNVRNVPLWFVAGGLMSGLGLVLGFSAFFYLPAWAVAVLKGTQGLWTLLWSYLFIREEERLGWSVVLSAALTFGGITVIALAS